MHSISGYIITDQELGLINSVSTELFKIAYIHNKITSDSVAAMDVFNELKKKGLIK
jgi:hypothetical protein